MLQQKWKTSAPEVLGTQKAAFVPLGRHNIRPTAMRHKRPLKTVHCLDLSTLLQGRERILETQGNYGMVLNVLTGPAHGEHLMYQQDLPRAPSTSAATTSTAICTAQRLPRGLGSTPAGTKPKRPAVESMKAPPMPPPAVTPTLVPEHRGYDALTPEEVAELRVEAQHHGARRRKKLRLATILEEITALTTEAVAIQHSLVEDDPDEP
eukprot:453486-Amphidinium_carterae.1